MAFEQVSVEELEINPFTMINKEWMLITAGDESGLNTMTASWGSLGETWGRYTSAVFLRPQRYTREFVDNSTHYSLCVFDENYRDALNLCGSKTGRECDKIAESGLTPKFDHPAPYFNEAKLVFICRKLYCQEMLEDCLIEPKIVEQFYPQKDFHLLYIGEIETVLRRKD